MNPESKMNTVVLRRPKKYINATGAAGSSGYVASWLSSIPSGIRLKVKNPPLEGENIFLIMISFFLRRRISLSYSPERTMISTSKLYCRIQKRVANMKNIPKFNDNLLTDATWPVFPAMKA